ncbi:hypothetical protein E4633_18985 [Geomonas terrae]|uniref:Uncharacterized protein n=1 Tax=Geomonas terrae TaxID=2562681 RepID=A0A4S1CAG3_9BACT|nr:hypothetical protein [Geomonas terrae]TGU70281.1 hypothetical protein E4633_18985 [Geomonas terrae]
MERLSKKCTAILVGALTCLAAGIGLAPRVEMAPLAMERQVSLKSAPTRRGANAAVGMMQGCAGGTSVSCHPQRYQPQL